MAKAASLRSERSHFFAMKLLMWLLIRGQSHTNIVDWGARLAM